MVQLLFSTRVDKSTKRSGPIPAAGSRCKKITCTYIHTDYIHTYLQAAEGVRNSYR